MLATILLYAFPATATIIRALIILLIIGVIMWIVNKYIPVEQPYKTIINAIVAVLVLLWIVSVFGLI